MQQIVQIDLTLFRFLIAGFFFLVTFAGIFVTIGKLLFKQKSQCTKLGTIHNAMWKDGRPLLQSTEGCKENIKEVNKEIEKEHIELTGQCNTIIRKLEAMDKKRDEVIEIRNDQMRAIELHMLKINIWYEETHKG